MEIRELRYFVVLAEELHFARAAARVGIEQSPLSKAISELERHLGVRLFIRTRRSTTLTCAGELLLHDARRILAQVDQACLNIAAAASGRSGRLRIAVCDGLAYPRIARVLAENKRIAQSSQRRLAALERSAVLRCEHQDPVSDGRRLVRRVGTVLDP